MTYPNVDNFEGAALGQCKLSGGAAFDIVNGLYDSHKSWNFEGADFNRCIYV